MATAGALTKRRVDALVAELELDVDAGGICHACLSFVSFALEEGGDGRKVAGKVTQVTPWLWIEGLEAHTFDAVRRACASGVPDAAAALEDLEQRTWRSPVTRAIVRRLAAELSKRTRTELRLEALARDRLRRAPPELN